MITNALEQHKREGAVTRVLAKRIKTPDIGGTNKTEDVTDAVIKN